MKTLIIKSISLLILITTCFADEIPTDSMYLGQTLPGKTAKIFNLPDTEGLAPAERLSISADGKEIFYSELNGWPATICGIKSYVYQNNHWVGPTLIFDGYIAPCLSDNDSIIYMEKNLTYAITKTFFSKRIANGWSTPIPLFANNRSSHYFQETNQKNFYTAASATTPNGSITDLFKIEITNGDTSFVNLGKPVNTTATENDFFIARDESFLLVCRPTSSSSSLLISYKKANGRWTNPKSLGNRVNLPGRWAFGPFVTKDNKYLFFGQDNSASYYIHWVKVDDLIDSLKYTNYTPYLKTAIPNQTDTLGRAYSYSISDTTFIDDDGNNTLTYSATLSNGNPLPAWLTFNPDTKTFSSPTLSETGSFIIKVTAKDTLQASVSSTFVLKVVNNVSISEERCFEQILQAYPNPFNPATTIKFNIKDNALVKLSIYNLKGELVENLVNNTLEAGLHNFTFNANDLASGIYMYKLQIGNKIIAKSMLLLK